VRFFLVVRSFHQKASEVLIHFWVAGRELRIDSGSTQTSHFLSIPLKRLFDETNFIESVVVNADRENAGHYKRNEKDPAGDAADEIPHAHVSLKLFYGKRHPISEL